MKVYNETEFTERVATASVQLVHQLTQNLNFSVANDFYIDKMTGQTTINVSNFANYRGTKWHIYLEQSTTGHTITFGTGFGKNFGGVDPTENADEEVVITCWVNRAGTAVDYIVTNE